jgi:N6-adenosine-specific RNA methylase IME4
MIEDVGGCGIELFAREKTDGWDVWGNEVESDIELPIQSTVALRLLSEERE